MTTKKKKPLMNLKVTISDNDLDVNLGYFTMEFTKNNKLIFWPSGHGIKNLIYEYILNEFLKENIDIIGDRFYGTENFYKTI